MIELTKDDIHKFAPPPASKSKRAIYDGYVDALVTYGPELFEKHDITTHARFCVLMGNWAHECARFTIITENMNYTTVKRIMVIFGAGYHSAGITEREARGLVRNGPKLAERVYGLGNPRKALELGNTAPLDGWRYRGTGIVQITGKRDHFKYAGMLGIEPEQLKDPRWAVAAALLEWDAKNCNDWCDKGDYRKVRRLINGGYNGYSDVQAMTRKAERIWPADLFETGTKKKRPKLVVANSNDDGVLRLGDEGDKVRELQELLAKAGHHAAAIDGDFGALTHAALVAFQAARGFPLTGEIKDDDADQWNALRDASIREVEIEEKDLRTTGSKTLTLWDRVQSIGRFIVGVPSAVMAGEVSGLAPVERAADGLEKVQGLVARYSELIGWLLSPKILVWVLAILLGWGLIRWAKAGRANRVDDARLKRNLGT